MKIIQGILAGLAGAAVGAFVAGLVAAFLAKALRVPDREGASGYFMISIAFLGGIAGLVVGILIAARSAGPGLRFQAAGGTVLGFGVLAGLVVLAVWAFINLREGPLKYGGKHLGSMATLEMEFRLPRSQAPEGEACTWLDVEVHTRSTRPVGTVLSSGVREEDGMLVIPVSESPLIRSSRRLVVVRVGKERTEVFDPRLPARPDPEKGFNEWRKAITVEVLGPDGPVPAAGKGVLEMRARISVFGQ